MLQLGLATSRRRDFRPTDPKALGDRLGFDKRLYRSLRYRISAFRTCLLSLAFYFG
jgi:hypothetical protein